jgi:UTP--glucose-1-phosphate uridylyltransferase
MKVRKAIIPAAGLGTRFLPATKAMPKEMLPIVNKPTIQYIVEEAVKSGIEEILIITGKGKRAIEDHFDYAFELEHRLLQNKKYDLLEQVELTSSMADLYYLRQKEPKGLGHAILCAKNFVGNEPFAVLLGDDVTTGTVPCTYQLIQQYEKVKSSVIGVKHVPKKNISRYGMVESCEDLGDLYKINHLIEKPPIGTTTSSLAIMGRYVLTADIFSVLEETAYGVNGELQLTDALVGLNKFNRIYAYEFEGERYDVGEPLGLIKTSIKFAMESEEFKHDLIQYLEEVVSQNGNEKTVHID